MSKVAKIKISGAIILALVVVYSLITVYTGDIRPNTENMVNVYFFNPAAGRLEAERRVLPEGDYDYREIASYLWGILISEPESTALTSVFPENLVPGVEGSVELRLLQTTREERGARRLEVLLNEDYLDTSPVAEILFRSAVVWTFTELDWISDVEFFLNGAPLTRLDGNPIGLMNRDNVLIMPQITMEHIVRRTVELHFVNSALTGLVIERRTVEIPSNLTIERVVLNELMRGPATPGLISLIPSETVINDVYTESLTMTCYVDLNPAFDLRLMPGTPSRKLAVYSIVNTLTGLGGSDISEVQFLINGERPTGRNLEIDLSQSFEFNESLVIPRFDIELM